LQDGRIRVIIHPSNQQPLENKQMTNSITTYEVKGTHESNLFYAREEAEKHQADHIEYLKGKGYDSLVKNVVIEETENKYANLHGYSDVYPYEIIRVVSGKTIEVRAMEAELDPTWKPDITPGGFAGHCNNNRSQRHTYKSNPEAKVTRIRLQKNGSWKSKGGRHILSATPYKFYDYNF